MKLIKLAVVLVALMGATHAFAQTCTYGSPDYNTPNCQIQNSDNDVRSAQEQRAANNAEAQRQEQIRALAQIEKYRNTPAYGAIAVSDRDNSSAWGGGYMSKEEASQHALKSYSQGEAHVATIFSNTCAGMANLRTAKNSSDAIIAFDTVAETALNKAWGQCEAKYGKGKCAMANNDEAMCSGYNYGVFKKPFWDRF